MFRSLRALSEVPRLRSLLSLSLLARIHMSALPVAVSFLIADWTGSYASVGLLSGAMAVGQAVAGPVRGRIADRDSATAVLFKTGVGYAVGLALLILLAALAPSGLWPVAVVVTFLTGLMLPPVSQLSRSVWPRLVKDEQRQALYTLDSTGYEVIAMIGPLLATAVVTLSSGAAAVVMCAVLAAGGAMAFGIALRAAGFDRAEQTASAASDKSADRRSLLRDSVFLRASLVPFFLMAALFSVNLSLVAWGRSQDEPKTAGVLIALFSMGAAIGGLVAVSRGGKQSGGWATSGLLVAGLMALALLLPPVSDHTPVWGLAVVTVLTGTAVAPSLGASQSRIGALAPPERRAEAFGWLATSTTSGAALMLPLTGWLLDLRGPAASIGSGAVAALISAALVFSLPSRAEERDERPDGSDDSDSEPTAEVN
ncbi:MFS transporter [Streptomyces botrytidirepellens]|uniref:MFS transporter n=1 Tax=Streptomyces botrytidirepellens TaxID=2486417 RepID=A0A3M8WYN0_9ACTN|nr:MFS transporter [Streptomyces botrytidirepellens]RNG34160.1 MFS transporter [Streptomyces botrytidirepellens]